MTQPTPDAIRGVSLEEFERVVHAKVAESDQVEGQRAVFIAIGGYLFRPADVRLDSYGSVIISLDENPAATVGTTTAERS
ncbi:hypothetical protein IT072_03700 [Leifsonia sp. ZF2019]|uniref:hypothetical protein n=1 Tax=Leifsonia sp. ZF2019 TaxID=2781978 RepID=UPI001CBDDDCD|nr:hypothetical protein [Leifsonia sp. ZF2019]UAJ80163.1 hypothetical protein IT072_03700 [Leifsonia sp. ZF2019]